MARYSHSQATLSDLAAVGPCRRTCTGPLREWIESYRHTAPAGAVVGTVVNAEMEDCERQLRALDDQYLSEYYRLQRQLHQADGLLEAAHRAVASAFQPTHGLQQQVLRDARVAFANEVAAGQGPGGEGDRQLRCRPVGAGRCRGRPGTGRGRRRPRTVR